MLDLKLALLIYARADSLFFSQYETNSEDVRRSFEEHGEIKTFFDLIATRGMVFVTYVGFLNRTPCSY